MKKTSLIKSICVTTGILAPVATLGVVGCSCHKAVGEIPIEDLIIEDRALIGLKPGVDVSQYDTLKVPKEVVEVSSYAFAGFNGSVNLPSNIQNIVFEEGDDILYIGSYAFGDCQYIKNVKFANRTEFVGDSAFNSCDSLRTLDFSSWEKTKMENVSPFTESNIFVGCPANGQLILPAGCDEDAFFMLGGTGLKTDWFNFKPDEQKDESTNSYFYVDPEGAKCLTRPIDPNKGNKLKPDGSIDLTTYVVPSEYKKIAPNAFRSLPYYGQIKHIEFESGSILEKIGFCAFANNSKLEDVDLSNCSNLKIIDVAAFQGTGTSLLKTVTLPSSLKNIGSYAFYANSNSLTSVNLKDTQIEKVGVGAFAECANLQTLELPSTTTWISAMAISGNNILTEIQIPKNIVYIGAAAFSGCSNVTKVTFQDAPSIKYIGSKAFCECNLTNFYIPDSVTYIGDGALSGNSSLETITVNSNEHYKLIANNKLLSTKAADQIIAATSDFNWNFASIEQPRAVKSINEFAFYNMKCNSSTTNLDLSCLSNLKTIKSSAFENVKSENENSSFSLFLPNSVEKIGHSAFSHSDINEVKFTPQNPVSFGNSVFFACQKMGAVTIPDKVSIIPKHAFENCKAIKSLTIPSSVKEIQTQAFRSCPGVTALHLESFDEVPNWDGLTAAFDDFGVDSGLTCYIKNEDLKSGWETLFTKLRVDYSKWHWNWEHNNK